jgi:hypothetical protein
MQNQRSPSPDFIYLAGRLFPSVNPPNSLFPEALTHDKAQRFLEAIGRDFELIFDTTPLPLYASSPQHLVRLVTSSAHLLDATWTPTTSGPIPTSDGNLNLRFSVSDRQAVTALCDRRDPDWGQHAAYERRIVHWGTQNWGGVSVSFVFDTRQLFRCDVDVFCVDDSDLLSDTLHIYLVSLTPTASNAHANDDPAERKASEEELSSPASTKDMSNSQATVRCLRCGGGIDVSLALLANSIGRESIILIGCPDCDARYKVRAFAREHQLRSGVSYEVQEVGATS